MFLHTTEGCRRGVFIRLCRSLGSVIFLYSHLIFQFFAVTEISGILQGCFCNICQSLFCKKALVRGHCHIGEGEETLDRGALKDALRHILIDKLRFLFIYIKSHCKEFMIADSCDQILCFNKTASGSVYQDHAILHFGDGVFVDEMMGFLCQRAVKTDQITCA